MEKNRFQKAIAILAVLTLVVGLFTGCGKKAADSATKETSKETTKADEGNSPESNMVSAEPVTFTMLYGGTHQEDWLIFEEITKRTNVTLEKQVVPVNDYKTKREIVLNSGKLPDIFVRTMASEVSDYTSSGLILPVSDYFDRMPNFTAFVDKYDYQRDIDAQTELDGKYYMIPVGSYEELIGQHSWLIRMDLLEKFSLDTPKTLEDVYNVAKRFKQEYPNVYPITNRFGSGNILSTVCYGFNTKAGWDIGTMFQYNPDSDDFYFAPSTNDYKAMLQWMNKLFEEGLLDPEFNTLETNIYEERAINNNNLILVDWIGNQNRYNLHGKETNPDFNVQPFLPPTGPDGYYASGKLSKHNMGWVFSSKVAEKDTFDTFLRYIDWYFTDEAATLLSFGVEGKTFEYDENGKKRYINTDEDHFTLYGLNNNEMSVRRDGELAYALADDFVKGIYKEMAEKKVFKPVDPAPKLNTDQKDEVKLYDKALLDYVNTMTEKYIFGVESLDNWDQFVSECESKGVSKLKEIYNTAYSNQKK